MAASSLLLLDLRRRSISSGDRGNNQAGEGDAAAVGGCLTFNGRSSFQYWASHYKLEDSSVRATSRKGKDVRWRPMEPLTRDVIYATGLPRQVARIAIACVLVFLSKAAPNSELAGCAERLRQEIIAAAHRDSGMAAVEQLADLDALSCADVGSLATTLANIGPNPTQIIRTASEVVTYAERAVGARRGTPVDSIGSCQRFLRFSAHDQSWQKTPRRVRPHSGRLRR